MKTQEEIDCDFADCFTDRMMIDKTHNGSTIVMRKKL